MIEFKVGYWIKDSKENHVTSDNESFWHCSLCGAGYHVSDESKDNIMDECPKCGAMMAGYKEVAYE